MSGLLSDIPHKTAEAIGQEDGMLNVDSSEIAQQGKESVGVARQDCGSPGKVENCQSGVFVGYTSRIGYGLVDRGLFAPEVWFTEPYDKLRKKCGMPQRNRNLKRALLMWRQ